MKLGVLPIEVFTLHARSIVNRVDGRGSPGEAFTKFPVVQATAPNDVGWEVVMVLKQTSQ